MIAGDWTCDLGGLTSLTCNISGFYLPHVRQPQLPQEQFLNLSPFLDPKRNEVGKAKEGKAVNADIFCRRDFFPP